MHEISVGLTDHRVQEALEVREAFTSFVGQTFFQQMFKAMRSSVGKPAYFHGGQAEEIFRGQLDQTLSEEMTTANASDFSRVMFERQFPQLAEVLNAERSGLADLSGLPRR